MALGFGWLVISRLALGPWPVILAAAMVAAVCVKGASGAWPSKLPAGLQSFAEKWDKGRSRSQKTVSGQLVWNLGRSVIAGFATYHALEAFSAVGGLVQAAIVFGFAISVGFFGLQAAIWAGIAVILAGHGLAMSKLQVDFSDPNSRSAMEIAWRRGANLSWWWAIGAAFAAPIWIGLSALLVHIGSRISDEIATRVAEASTKKKIEARRLRRREQIAQAAVDPVQSAVKAREDAQAKVDASARGENGSLPVDGAAEQTGHVQLASEAAETPKGEQKVEQDKNKALLTRFIGFVQSIMHSEENDIDVTTPARRSFDRVVLALDDRQIDLLRSNVIEGSQLLVDYYNKLSGVEAIAISNGDGEIVTTSAVPKDVLDENEKAHEDPDYETGFARDHAGIQMPDRGPDDVDDEDMPDVLDQAEPSPVYGRRAAAGLGAENAMLSETKAEESGIREGADGTPEGNDALPTRDDAAEEFASEDRFDSAASMDNDDDGDEPVPPVVAAGNVNADHSDSGAKTADDAPDEQQSAESKAVSDEKASKIEEAATAATEGASEQLSGVGDQELRDAAGVILSGSYDRDFVIKTMEYFPAQSDLMTLLGMNEIVVGPAFGIYSKRVAGARLEVALEEFLEAGNADEVRRILAEIVNGEWPIDPGLNSRVEAWLEEQDRAAEGAESDRKAEETRKAEEEAAKASKLASEQRKLATLIVVGAVDDDLLDLGDELFPNVETLAETLEVDVTHVEGPFSNFNKKRIAKKSIAALRAAWTDRDLLQVQKLLLSPEAFEAYPGYEEVLEGAKDWVRAEEESQRLLGLTDRVDESCDKADAATIRLFMRKQVKTTKEQAQLIDVEFPGALEVLMSFERVLAIQGDQASKAIRQERERAAAGAASLAKKILEGPETAKPYVLSFLDTKFLKDGEDAWGLVVRLAGVSDPLESSETEHAPESGDGSVTELNHVLEDEPAVLTSSDVQKLDPKAEISRMDFSSLKSAESYIRMFSLACQTYIGDDGADKPAMKREGLYFIMHLGKSEGDGAGKILIFASIERAPVWYHQETDTVYLVATKEENKVVAKNGQEFFENIRSMFAGDGGNDRVKGVVLMSPFLNKEGIKSFEPFIARFENDNLMLSNEHLPDNVFSDFVDRSKAA